ncbi:OLC1v1015599C1 [Oldenlandia corymbosa var. corymbosa]|uniref:OLC1v1015599C1 n=1 Tax=Oldenlandia corymbosa var. corymbosa TaxID=529605 RepID=A0AAV1E5T2_OLDCO|nr:OLC1v1015599C1 [Oldenlandia corymbosa var. corymbosa]
MNGLPVDQQETLLSLYWRCGSTLDSVCAAALELNLFEIISKAGGELSAAEIASHLPTQNEQAPEIIDRMLHLLAAHSIVKCTVVHHDGDDDSVTRLYGLTPLSMCFLPDKEGISRAPLAALFNDRAFLDSWKYLKDAVLEGGSPFQKANNGVGLFEYMGKNSRFAQIFDGAMQKTSTNFTREVLQHYKGFENLKEIVDVGGGIGSTLNMIISKYPGIKGINFDLPHVIEKAPIWPSVEHVQGDMFQSVPKGETIVIMRVLHNWSDEKCVKVLKNCLDVLPDFGKVIVIEMIPSESSETNISSRVALSCDMIMFALTQGGKGRSQREFEALAKKAGFESSKLACRTQELCVLEFYKN